MGHEGCKTRRCGGVGCTFQKKDQVQASRDDGARKEEDAIVECCHDDRDEMTT